MDRPLRIEYEGARYHVMSRGDGRGRGRGERFDYSRTNQLTQVRYNADQVWTGNPANQTRSVIYAYTPDTLNRSSVTDNGVVTNYSANGMNQYGVWYGYPIQYDGNFNFHSVGGWQYDYAPEKRLLAVTAYGAARGSFVYDGLGRCVKRTLLGVTTVINYDGWRPIMEWSSPTQWVAWNTYGAGADEIVWRGRNGMGYLRYHTDRHGNVTAVLDGSGNILERYSYDAFGMPTVTDSGGTLHVDANNQPQSWYGNRFMFQGREYLNEVELYDFRHRFYDPGMGRFYQSDPLGLQSEGEKLSAGQKALFSPGGAAPEAFTSSEMNLFRYCGDDPVDGSDPTGLEDDGHNVVIGILDGAAFGLGTVLTANNGGPDIESDAYQGGLRAGIVLGMATGSTEVRGAKTAYQTALDGGRHAGFLRTYVTKTLAQLGRAARSIAKQIARHEEMIRNPAKFIPHFDELPPQQQKGWWKKYGLMISSGKTNSWKLLRNSRNKNKNNQYVDISR